MFLGYLEITGGIPLHGKIEVQGSKNAVLPILASCMLGEGACTIENCPSIGDVDDTLEILKLLGCRVEREGRTVCIDASSAGKNEIESMEAARIRSSVLFLGALLGRMKRAVLPLPGGCAIGRRPIDIHIKALEKLGACFAEDDKVVATARQLLGDTVVLPFPSVGATENTILAAATAHGITWIKNAAREPEIDELCEFLNCRGADIERTKNGDIRVCGVERLRGTTYRVKADRIVTGTYLLAAAATGGEILITNDNGSCLRAFLQVLEKMGAGVIRSPWGGKQEGIRISSPERLLGAGYLETAPYPGFPTDLQSPLMAVLCRASGKSCIREKIFENRFKTADELVKMGAEIEIDGDCARISGVPQLYGAVLEAPDLRGGAALVLGALQAKGCTKIGNIGYIDRGYENIERDLRLLGADIRRVDGNRDF